MPFFSKTPCAVQVKGLLGNKEGAVLKSGAGDAAPWRILSVEGGSSSQMLQVGGVLLLGERAPAHMPCFLQIVSCPPWLVRASISQP